MTNITKEKLEELGIDLSKENNEEFHPDANREFVLKCTNCGCENAKEITSMYDDAIATANTVMNETYEAYYYCPQCKTKVKKYTI